MKTYCRRLSIMLALILTFSFVVNASNIVGAELINISEEEAKNAAVNFMQDYTNNIYLYQSNNLVEHTALSMSKTQRSAISKASSEFAYFTETRQLSKETTLSDKSGYLLEKAEYQTALHRIQNIVHEQFVAEYEIHDVTIIDNIAQVCLTEHKSFFYAGKSFDSSLSEDFEIFLVKNGLNWLVFDMICDDSFDCKHRSSDFDAQAAINDFETAYITSKASKSDEVTLNAQVDPPVSPMTVYSGHTRTYNRDNAVYYAYTYSKMNSNDFLDYYNENFLRINTQLKDEDGNPVWDYNADCINFVSQCFYAGFYGSNDPTSIDGGNFPQDSIGTAYDERWIAKPTGNYYAWTAISYFQDYLSHCNSVSNETKMNALQYTFPAVTASDSTGFTLSTPYSLRGVLAEVDGGSGSQYGHAVLITVAEGYDRDELYFTAHTTDAKNILFSTRYYDDAVRIVIPVTMQELKACTGGGAHTYTTITTSIGRDSTCNYCGYCKLYVKNNLQNCVPKGATRTLTATTSQIAYRLAMKVVAPDGTVTWLDEITNTDSYSDSFTFNQIGLYSITLYARDLDPNYYHTSSISVSSTYTIRCY